MKCLDLLLLMLLTATTLKPSSSSSSSSSAETFSVNGKVIELDDSSFDAAISAFDYVFIDFYAPWCGHCKSLSPELDAAAPVLAKLKEPIVIAKVNADKFTGLAKKYDVEGFPTLKLFMHGVPMEYTGPRKEDILVQYLKKFVAPGVSILDSEAAVSAFVESAGTVFPIYIGFGLNDTVIQKLAVKYRKKAWFAVANDFSEEVMNRYDFDKVPALVSLLPEYNEKSIFYGPFEDALLEDFIKQSLLPLVAPINYDTLRTLEDDMRNIILTIVHDEEQEKSKELVKLLKGAASANRDLVFAYVGYKQFAEFAESFGGTKKAQLPKMVIWDGSEEYFSVNGSEIISEDNQANQISRFIEGYREGRTTAKKARGLSFSDFISSLIGIGVVYVLVIMVVIIIIVRKLNKDDSGYERVATQEHDRHRTLDQVDQTSTSMSETESKEYGPGDKED